MNCDNHYDGKCLGGRVKSTYEALDELKDILYRDLHAALGPGAATNALIRNFNQIIFDIQTKCERPKR